jgi:hypothetical protein
MDIHLLKKHLALQHLPSKNKHLVLLPKTPIRTNTRKQGIHSESINPLKVSLEYPAPNRALRCIVRCLGHVSGCIKEQPQNPRYPSQYTQLFSP